MLQRPLGTVVVAAASVVVVPYAIALLSNILYGWPLCSRRYRRAFDPRKVFALNCSIVLQLKKLRYLGLLVRWKRFYQKATRDRLIRDLEYGSNGNCLDVYFPSEHSGHASLLTVATGPTVPKPIVIFVYGGSWGSGDKNMYGLLCSQLADRLRAVVICPNYSTYPKGFVDDMVQDVSDAVAFAHKFACDFGADKDCIMLLGHSAGAHLAAMTVLELSMKLLSDAPQLSAGGMTDEQRDAVDSVRRPDSLEVSIIDSSSVLMHSVAVPLELHEKHFNGDSSNRQTGGLTGSMFCVVDDVDEAAAANDALKSEGMETSTPTVVTESFCMIDDNNSTLVSVPPGEAPTLPTTRQDVEISSSDRPVQVKASGAGDGDLSAAGLDEKSKTDAAVAEESRLEMSGDKLAAEEHETKDLLPSIKLVVGLAGVYDIAKHYVYEMSRGYEDISTMARAMYGPKHFSRFSPSVIVQSLPTNAKLPPMHLIHGGSDRTVPVSSTTAFGEAVWKRGISQVTATILDGCGHGDICMDLMESDRNWHEAVFTEIASVYNRHVVRQH